MKRSRFTDSQIMDALKQAENSMPVPDVFLELGIHQYRYLLQIAFLLWWHAIY